MTMYDEAHNPWTTLSEKPVYDNPWINLTEYSVINPGGGKGIYGKVHFKNMAIGILALDDDLNTWLVGQYRYTIDQYSWEIPEGGGMAGTDPLEAAKRELMEETGFTASEWTPLLDLYLSNSVSDEYAVIYLARGLQAGEAEPEETEQLALKKMPFDEAYQLVMNGKIKDSITVAAIFKVKIMLLEAGDSGLKQ